MDIFKALMPIFLNYKGLELYTLKVNVLSAVFPNIHDEMSGEFLFIFINTVTVSISIIILSSVTTYERLYKN